MKNNLIHTILFLIFICVGSAISAKDITLEDIFVKKKYNPKIIEWKHSRKDTAHYYMLEKGTEIVQYSYRDPYYNKTVFHKELSNGSIDYIFDYQFDGQETKCLITTDVERIYRISTRAVYYIFDLHTGTIKPVYDTTKIQLAGFSQDGKNVSFISDNNLYIKNLETGEIIQVTNDGKKNYIINGKSDWLYEEEFRLKKAYEWSPGSDKIAFYKFDESGVDMQKLIKYDSLYPTVYEYKYPQAGKENPKVSIHVFDAGKKQTKKIRIKDTTDYYIPGIKWVNDSLLCITKLNRAQTKVQLLLVNVINGYSRIIYEEKDEKYLTCIEDDHVTFLNNMHFIVKSGISGYRHFYLYDIYGGRLCRLTHGNWDVIKLLGADEMSGKLFYTSCEGSSVEQHVYSVGLDGKNKKRLTEIKGSHFASFSAGYQYFIHEYSSFESPYEYSVYDSTGRYLYSLEKNSMLKKKIDTQFTEKEFIRIPASDSLLLDAYIIKPGNMEKNKKYPLLIYVYGGPQSKRVMNEWDYFNAFFQMLCQNGYVVACIDNRGTENRGEDFRKSNYLQLGIVETEDQIAAAKYLSGMAFVDSSRIGIFGWSYGGYISIFCMLKGSDIFKTGIAIAPITCWRFYDTVYTERYMKKPGENEKGYENTSLFNYIDALEGDLYIIYGSYDDNVLPVNSMMFVKEMINEGKQFTVMAYPDKNHHIYGGLTRYQLFESITEYIFKHL